MPALVNAFVLSLTLFSSVLAGPTAITRGVKNTRKIFPDTGGLASGALDPSVYLPESKLQLFPIELPAESGLQRILTLESTEVELCPHSAFKNFALANPDKTRYSAPWRVACGVDFYGGDLSPEPVSTEDGPVGCSVICQQTSRCKGTVFWPSNVNPNFGSCYLKKTLSNPISRPGFTAVVRRNDLEPDLALTTSKRFYEGQRYDAIADVYDIHTDGGEHHPHPKLFENYVNSVLMGASASNNAVATSPSPVSSSAALSMPAPTSTSSQVTISPVPIYFSISPNSAAVPFVSAPSEVASSTSNTFPTVVFSSPTTSTVSSSLQIESTMVPTRTEYLTAVVPTSVANTVALAMPAESASSATRSTFATIAIVYPSPSTLATVSTFQWSTSSASRTSLVLSSPFLPVASPSRTTYPTESEADPTVKPVSTFSVQMEGFPADSEWKPANIASVDNHGSSHVVTLSSEVHLEGFPTEAEWKPAITTSVSNYESSQTISSSKVVMEGFPTSAEWKPAVTTQATSSSKIYLEGFPTDADWKPAITTSVSDYRSIQVMSSAKVYTDGFHTDADWKPAATTQATSSSAIYLEGFPTDVEWKPAATTSIINHEFKQDTSSSKFVMEGFPTDAEWKSAPTTSRSSLESTQATSSFEVGLEGFLTDIEWKAVSTASANGFDSYHPAPPTTKTVLKPMLADSEAETTPITSRKVTESLLPDTFEERVDPKWLTLEPAGPTSTQEPEVPAKDAEPTQSTASYINYSPEGIPYATETYHICTGNPCQDHCIPLSRLHEVEAGELVPLRVRDAEACNAWLRDRGVLKRTQDEKEVSEFPRGSDTPKSLGSNEEATNDFSRVLIPEEAAKESTATSILVDVPEPTSTPIGWSCSDPCDVMCDSDVNIPIEEQLSRCSESAAREIFTSQEMEPAPGPTQTEVPVSLTPSSTYVAVSANPTHSLGIDDRMRAQNEKLTHSHPFDPIEVDDYFEVTKQYDVEPAEIKSASPPTETLTEYLVSTVSVGRAIVTRTRTAKPKVSSAEFVSVTGIATKPTATQFFPMPEPSTSRDFHRTETATDAAPTELAMLTATLLAIDVPAEATQTLPCAQFDEPCESMVIVFAPLATLESSSNEGASVPSYIAAPTTVAVSVSSPSPESWPTRTLHVANNIIPAVNPMTVACALGPSDVDCNKFASIVMWVTPMATMSLPTFKTIVTHKPTEHLVTKSLGTQPASTPVVAAPQAPPVNLPVPIQTSYSIAIPVAPQSNPVQDNSPPPPPNLPPNLSPNLPPPIGEIEVSSTYDSTLTVIPSDTSSVTIISMSPLPLETGIIPISPLPSETGVIPISPLPSESEMIPISPPPSETRTITSSSPVSTSTLATATPPKSSTKPPGNENRPGMGEDSTYYDSASFRLSAPWLTLLASLCAGVQLMV